MRDLPDPTPDTPSLAQLREAFERLAADDSPRWGRMNPAQMTRHCRVFIDLCMGRVAVSGVVRVLARMLGPLFIRRLLAKPPTRSPKNLKTLPPLRMDDPGLTLSAERERLFAAFDELEALAGEHRHPLYGRMRKQDVIALVRHHTAHHALQFGLLRETA